MRARQTERQRKTLYLITSLINANNRERQQQMAAIQQNNNKANHIAYKSNNFNINNNTEVGKSQ